MTTAAHVLLPRETVEQIRHCLYFMGYSLLDEKWAPKRKLLTALDAALNAEEPFERLEGGEIVVPTSLQWQSVLDRHHRYVPLIRLREIAPSETDDPDDTVLTAHIEWTHEDARAVALALIALAADGEGRG